MCISTDVFCDEIISGDLTLVPQGVPQGMIFIGSGPLIDACRKHLQLKHSHGGYVSFRVPNVGEMEIDQITGVAQLAINNPTAIRQIVSGK